MDNKYDVEKLFHHKLKFIVLNEEQKKLEIKKKEEEQFLLNIKNHKERDENLVIELKNAFKFYCNSLDDEVEFKLSSLISKTYADKFPVLKLVKPINKYFWHEAFEYNLFHESSSYFKFKKELEKELSYVNFIVYTKYDEKIINTIRLHSLIRRIKK